MVVNSVSELSVGSAKTVAEGSGVDVIHLGEGGGKIVDGID